MKVKQWIQMILIALLMICTLIAVPSAKGQEGRQEVYVRFSVKNNLPDFTSQDNESVSFDIFRLEDSTVVYSYRNGQGNVSDLHLTEGKYRFRLYYWDRITKELKLVNDELVATIAEPTQEELDRGKKQRITTYPGSVNELGDGSIVLDIDFEIKATDYLYNPASGRYEIDWQLFLADELTALANDALHQETTETSMEPSETEMQTSMEPEASIANGALTIKAIDEEGRAISGVIFEFNGQAFTTDDSGFVNLADLQPGMYPVHIVALPEEYEGQWSQAIEIEAQITKILEVTLMKKLREEPEGMRSVTFKVIDQQGKGVANAVITFNNQQYTTNEDGQVMIDNLPDGVYQYELSQLPDNYLGQNVGQLTLDASLENHQVRLPVEFAQQMGSLTILVQDQEKVPIPNVDLLFNGTELLKTDETGYIRIPELLPGTYSYTLNEVPQGYSSESSTFSAEINDREVIQTVTLQKAPSTQIVKLKIVDQFHVPVPNVQVQIDHQSAITNEHGEVTFDAIKVGQQTYHLTQLPEKFLEEYEGTIDINKEQVFEDVIVAERRVEKGRAEILVKNQEGQPIPSAIVQFGGLQATANENGLVVFDHLDLGIYDYQVIEVPNGIDLSNEERSTEISEGLTFEDSLTLNEHLTGDIHVLVKDSNNQPLANVTFRINNQEYVSNEQGQVMMKEMPEGTFDFYIEDQKAYRFQPNKGQVTVNRHELTELEFIGEKVITTTESSLITTDSPVTTGAPPTTTEPPTRVTELPITTTQAPVTTTHLPASTQVSTTTLAPATSVTTTSTQASTMNVNQPLRQYIDRTTNIEVWVHPEDAKNIASIAVNKISTNLPPLLANKDVEAYSIRAIKADGSEMTFTKAVQVKVPTRLVQSQIQVLRMSNDQLTSIAHSIFNQRANFTTQTLGQFAIVYGDKVPVSHEETTVSEQTTQRIVNTTKETQGRIPATGERASWLLVAVAILAIGLGLILIRNRKK